MKAPWVFPFCVFRYSVVVHAFEGIGLRFRLARMSAGLSVVNCGY